MINQPQIFPFAAGIPYRADEKDVIIPKVIAANWHNLFRKKTSVLCVNSIGFIENLFTLSYFECLYSIYGSRYNMEWNGNSMYENMVLLQSLATPVDRFPMKSLIDYPVPAFFNSDRTATFINPLNNYLEVYSFLGFRIKHNQQILLKQLFQNLMIPWNNKYIPQFRLLEMPIKLAEQAKLMKFNLKQKYILIMPDDTGMSIHKKQFLNWTISDIKSFSSMLRGTDYNLIILTSVPQKYNGINTLIAPPTIENILWLIKGSSYVLAQEIDFLLGTLILGDGVPISKRVRNPYSIHNNKNFMRAGKKAMMYADMSPIKIFEAIQEKDINEKNALLCRN
jgi:hypothetical protein